eukprot:COSAG02_NODE_524_length_20723_cov_79.399438_15_plen_95_part_00
MTYQDPAQAGTILQPELHVVVSFVGGPVSGFAKRGTDGAVWSRGTFLQIYSEARGRGEHQLSRFLTVFQPETAPGKGDQIDENRHVHCVLTDDF